MLQELCRQQNLDWRQLFVHFWMHSQFFSFGKTGCGYLGTFGKQHWISLLTCNILGKVRFARQKSQSTNFLLPQKQRFCRNNKIWACKAKVENGTIPSQSESNYAWSIHKHLQIQHSKTNASIFFFGFFKGFKYQCTVFNTTSYFDHESFLLPSLNVKKRRSTQIIHRKETKMMSSSVPK